jgi:hypothetical protein
MIDVVVFTVTSVSVIIELVPSKYDEATINVVNPYDPSYTVSSNSIESPGVYSADTSL